MSWITGLEQLFKGSSGNAGELYQKQLTTRKDEQHYKKWTFRQMNKNQMID